MAATGRKFAIAERILTDVFEDTGELAEETAQVLIGSALTVLSDAIKDRLNNEPRDAKRLRTNGCKMFCCS